jgi:hypothetical protein
MARKKKDESFIPKGDDQEKKPKHDDESAWSKRLAQSKAFKIKYSGNWAENKRLIFNATDSGAKTGSEPAWMGGAENSVAYGWGLYQGLETSIYVQNPDVRLTSRDPIQMPLANALTHIVRYDNDQMDTKAIGNLLLLDTFIAGFGALIEDVKTEKSEDENGNIVVTQQEFEVRRIGYDDILFDPQARKLDLSDSRYLSIAWYPTVQELYDDPDITDLPDDIMSYPEAAEYTRIKDGNADSHASQRVGASMARGGGQGEKDPAFRTICVWEIFDKINLRKLYMTDNKHKIIGTGKWPCNLKFGPRTLFPVTLLYQHPIPGQFYPMPEATLIAPQLREINVLEQMISEDTRTKWRKYLTISGILTDDQKAQVTDSSVKNALIYVDITKLTELLGLPPGQSIDPLQFDVRKLVAPMEDVSPKKDLFQRYDMLEKEIQHIVGYGPAARGGMPSTRSAREAMMINQENQKKLDKRKDHIADFYKLTDMKHVRFMQQYMSVERYAKIYSKVADLQQWFGYKREDIQGDFEFEVLPGTLTPKNTEARKASEMELFKTGSAVAAQAGLDIRPFFYRLAEFNDWDGVDALFSNMDQIAEQVVQALIAFKKGKVDPQQFVELISQFTIAVLGPAKMKLIAEKNQGPGEQPPEGSRGDPTPEKTAQGVL